jgi:hypothetical protein
MLLILYYIMWLSHTGCGVCIFIFHVDVKVGVGGSVADGPGLVATYYRTYYSTAYLLVVHLLICPYRALPHGARMRSCSGKHNGVLAESVSAKIWRRKGESSAQRDLSTPYRV